MTILVVQSRDGDHIATWSLSDYPSVFDGHAVAELAARREGAVDAAEELERRIGVLSEWIAETDPRACAECDGEADPVPLAEGYPLCRECSTFETRRRYE